MVIKCNHIQHNHTETCQNALNAQESGLLFSLSQGPQFHVEQINIHLEFSYCTRLKMNTKWVKCRGFHAVLEYGAWVVPDKYKACHKQFAYVADNSGAGLCMQMGSLTCTLQATPANFIIGERDYANAVAPYWNMRGGLVIKRVPADILGLSFSHAHHC